MIVDKTELDEWSLERTLNMCVCVCMYVYTSQVMTELKVETHYNYVHDSWKFLNHY